MIEHAYFFMMLGIFVVAHVCFLYAYLIKLVPTLEAAGVPRSTLVLKLLLPLGLTTLFEQYKAICIDTKQPLFWANYLCNYLYLLIGLVLLSLIEFITLCDDCPNFR